MESFGVESHEPVELRYVSSNVAGDLADQRDDERQTTVLGSAGVGNSDEDAGGLSNPGFQNDTGVCAHEVSKEDGERASITKIDCESVNLEKDGEGYFDGPWGKCAIITILLATFFALSFGVGYGVAEIYYEVEEKTCGTQTVLPNFDGSKVEPGNWPWHVAIYTKTDQGNVFACSGALVMENWVITSASCVYGLTPEDITVWVGKQTKSVSPVDDTQSGLVVKSTHFYWVYEPGNKSPPENDIALLEMYNKAVLDDHVNTVCLPGIGKNVTEFGDRCYVTDYDSTDLIQMKTSVTANSNCDTHSHSTSQGMYCAEHSTSYNKAEIGSPMVCENDGVWSLYGFAIQPLGFGFGIYTNMVEYNGFAEYVIYQKGK